MLAGIVALVAGVAITLVALGTGSAPAVLRRHRGQRRRVRQRVPGRHQDRGPAAAPHERAGVLSLLFTVSYLGLGVPAVAPGSSRCTARA